MIEINLLPGSGKKARRRGVSTGFSTAVAGTMAQIKDPYMIAAAASAVVCTVVVGGLWFSQKGVESSLREKEAVAVQDSAKYATVIIEKRRAEMRRDSVMKQVKLIEAIDNDRFVWPHILAEVSKSTPQYTWIGDLHFINSAPSPAAVAPTDSIALSRAATAADTAALMVPRSDPMGPRPPLRFNMTGYTVDVQAMTRMIRDMEASPFIANVQLIGSKALTVGPTTVTEFVLDAEYEVADSSVIRRVAYAPTSR
jgi:Tfp pilus assembly protein PilN